MREITTHIVNPANDKLKILVLDEPGAGGANHAYVIEGYDGISNPSAESILVQPGAGVGILFQNGAIGENGVNGLTQEALLAIVIDRLQSFQAGPFASTYNAKALDHVLLAQEALLQRTRDRMARGVEGKTLA
jgi:hypothetical protein